MEKQFFIFGDSITYGAIDREGGWTARLRGYLDAKMIHSNLEEFYMLYNLGISGNNSNDLLERFESELKCRLDNTDETIVIFAIGTNDSQYVDEKGNYRVKPEEFKRNIEKLYEQAITVATRVIFVGLTNVNESKTMPVTWAKNKFYSNEDLEKYDHIVKEFCVSNNLLFIDMQNLLTREDLADGLHPNTEGFAKMFEKIKDALSNALII